MNTERNVQNGNGDLLRRLQALSFAMVECELYLDAYPECVAALDYYKDITRQYRELSEKYGETVAPVRHEDIVGDSWTWVNTPWPWQMPEKEK